MSLIEERISIKQFKGEGFDYWKYRVEMYMRMKEVHHCLQETKPSDESLGRAFEKKDNVAMHLIVSFISDEFLEVVREKSNAKEMWEALQKTFGKSGATSQHVLRRKLNNMKMTEGENMKEFLSRFDGVVRELKAAGGKLEECDIISHLTINLPVSYDPLVTALENIDGLTLEMVKSRLLMEEEKKKHRDGVQKPPLEQDEALKVKQSKWDSSNMKCYQCGKKGHFAAQCPAQHEEKPAMAKGAQIDNDIEELGHRIAEW